MTRTDPQNVPMPERKAKLQKQLPLNRPPRVSRLNTIGRVRQELVRVYRAARAGDLPVGDASKLAHVLYTVGRLLVAQDLEERVGKLERVAGERREGGW